MMISRVSCLIISRNILNNTGDNRQPCLIPTIIGKGITIWLFNRIEFVVELYNDLIILISSMCNSYCDNPLSSWYSIDYHAILYKSFFKVD